jgi:hypothetical protein
MVGTVVRTEEHIVVVRMVHTVARTVDRTEERMVKMMVRKVGIVVDTNYHTLVGCN